MEPFLERGFMPATVVFTLIAVLIGAGVAGVAAWVGGQRRSQGRLLETQMRRKPSHSRGRSPDDE
jgi:hypothetical protein